MNRLIYFFLITNVIFAQTENERKGIHQIESENHRSRTTSSTIQTPNPAIFTHHHITVMPPLRKIFGWHPYWAPDNAYQNYDYSVLTHIGYFSYETDTATGSYLTVHDWMTTPLIDTAHNHGIKVNLVVTNFGYDNNDKLLSDTVKQATMIDSLIQLLESRNGDGVNFDFESVSGNQRSNLVHFIQQTASRIKEKLPATEISMATPAVDWNNSFDLFALSQNCDYLIMMGYDYYYSGSSSAGPVAPLSGEIYNVTNSVTTYLSSSVSPGKLFLGVPWYGYDWPVLGSRRKSTATGQAAAYTYEVMEQRAQLYGKIFDVTTEVPWFSYQSGAQWHQAWYDDSASLALKYQLVNSKNLGGIGIWALSYQGDGPELWNAITDAFSDSTANSVSPAYSGIPEKYKLYQNYPNPFNSATTIGFSLPVESYVSVKITDVLGNDVATLIRYQRMKVGEYHDSWSGCDMKGCTVGSGLYLYRLVAIPSDGKFVYTETKKMLLVK